MDQVERWRHIYGLFPRIVTRKLVDMVGNTCGVMVRRPNIPFPEQLQQMYPNQQGDLLALFQDDMTALADSLVRTYQCEDLTPHLNDRLSEFIDELLFEVLDRGDNDNNDSSILSNDSTQTRASMDGGKFTYKGRKYVIRQGERSGKYILVKRKKIYLSQI